MMFPADRHPLDDSHWLSQVPAAFRKDVLDLCTFRRLNDQELTLGAEDAPGSVIGVVSGALAPAEWLASSHLVVCRGYS